MRYAIDFLIQTIIIFNRSFFSWKLAGFFIHYKMDDSLKEISNIWGIELPAGITEAEILSALAARVTQLLAKDPERFYQIMYRLDIAEKKVVNAINAPDAAMNIAKLIFQRQWQKAASRAAHKPKPGNDEDLKW